MTKVIRTGGERYRGEPLRRRAEARLRKSPLEVSSTSVEDARKLVHELQVHQVELEMQNEELRHIQLELESSRDRFARLYDFAPVGYLTLDAEGVIREANLTAARLLGLDRQMLLKQKLSRFIAPQSQDEFYLHRQQIFSNTGRRTCDLQMRRPEGTTFNGRLESILEPAADGHPARCLVALSDVTRLLRAEALLQSEANYRSLFELNPAPMWICDEDTLALLDVNEAALKLYGWSRHEFLRLTAKDIRPPGDVPEFVARVKQQVGSRVAFVGERRHLKRDGSVFDVAVTISSIAYAGRPARLALVNDITERKRAEALLQQFNATLERRVTERTRELTDANQRLQAIMDSALVGILTLDERGSIEFANPAAVKIFGYAPGQIVGRNIGRLMASPTQPRREDFLSHCLLARDTRFMSVKGEILGRRKDGKAIMLELALTRFAHDRRPLFLAMMRDITDRKRLERELLEISERERRQIGHDLHDGLGQHLHGLAYLAALLQKRLQQETSPCAAEAGQLNKYLTDALEMTRNLARGLQPVDAVPQGLMLALRELAERTRGVYRVDCRFECRSPVLIHRHSAANHLYRIAQEAVNNAMKHGKPTRVRIKLAATLSKNHSRRPGQRRGHPPAGQTRSRHGPARHAVSRRRDQRFAAWFKDFRRGARKWSARSAAKPFSRKTTISNETKSQNPAAFQTQTHPRGGRSPFDARGRDPMD